MADGKYINGVFVYYPKKAIEWAISKRGSTYTWGGGRGPNNRNAGTWDCSSFVNAAYYNGYYNVDQTQDLQDCWYSNSLVGFIAKGSPTTYSPKGTILLSRGVDAQGKPIGHTAIIVSGYQTIEAIDQDHGVNYGDWRGRGFTMTFEPILKGIFIEKWQPGVF